MIINCTETEVRGSVRVSKILNTKGQAAPKTEWGAQSFRTHKYINIYLIFYPARRLENIIEVLQNVVGPSCLSFLAFFFASFFFRTCLQPLDVCLCLSRPNKFCWLYFSFRFLILLYLFFSRHFPFMKLSRIVQCFSYHIPLKKLNVAGYMEAVS